ncbi:MAG: ribonuclease PH [Abditibacteriota bacterium]|nr:ribonuclease PH [Abditibacteriota bacterium]
MVRFDKREASQLRPIKLTRNFMPNAMGSVLIEAGNTRVICSASVEEKVPPFLKGAGSGWVTAEYAMLPCSCETRKQRDITRGKQDGRSMEIQRLIGRSIRSVCDLDALGERTVWLDCDVLQADGGTRTASVTGSFLAFADACAALLKERAISRLPFTERVAAVSCGIVGGSELLDLSYIEDSNAQVDMNVVMTSTGRIIEVQSTAEGYPFPRKRFDSLLDLAAEGIGRIFEITREAGY